MSSKSTWSPWPSLGAPSRPERSEQQLAKARLALEALERDVERALSTVLARPQDLEHLPALRLTELMRSGQGMARRVDELFAQLGSLTQQGVEEVDRVARKLEELGHQNSRLLRELVPAMADALRRELDGHREAAREFLHASPQSRLEWLREAAGRLKLDPSRPDWLSVLGLGRPAAPASNPDVIPEVDEALAYVDARLEDALSVPGTTLKLCLVCRDAAFLNLKAFFGGDVVGHAEWQVFAERPGQPREFVVRLNGGPHPAGAYASLPSWSDTNDPAVYEATVAREFPATEQMVRKAVEETYSFTGDYLTGGWVCHTVANAIAHRVLGMEHQEMRSIVRGSWMTDAFLGAEGHRFNKPRK